MLEITKSAFDAYNRDFDSTPEPSAAEQKPSNRSRLTLLPFVWPLVSRYWPFAPSRSALQQSRCVGPHPSLLDCPFTIWCDVSNGHTTTILPLPLDKNTITAVGRIIPTVVAAWGEKVGLALAQIFHKHLLRVDRPLDDYWCIWRAPEISADAAAITYVDGV